VSVQPANQVNSPADNVVGTAIERKPGACVGGRSVLPSGVITARNASN
jgi:hypothetical protein